MKPKEKAEKIKNDFGGIYFGSSRLDTDPMVVKQCAIIAVKLALEILESFGYQGAMYDDFETGNIVTTNEVDPIIYWQKLIEKL